MILEVTELQFSRDFLGLGGPLSSLAGYEYREEQVRMAEFINDVFTSGHIGMVEAGTGTGKSLAYLYPAICHALAKKKRIIISTNTINLQEQLIHKDIPFLRKILGADFQATVVKGWSNYPCLLRIQEIVYQLDGDVQQLLHTFSDEVIRGEAHSLTDLMITDEELIDDICAESDLCIRQDCSFFEQCPVMKAKQSAEKADLIIVNHHLLLADVQIRQFTGWDETFVLPAFRHVIFDEAHNLEDIATEFFGFRISELRLRRLLNSFFRPRARASRGLLPQLRAIVEKVKANDELKKQVLELIDWQLLAKVNHFSDLGTRFFHAILTFMSENCEDEEHLRLLYRTGISDQQVLTIYDEFIGQLSEFEGNTRQLIKLLEHLNQKESLNLKVLECRAYLSRMEVFREELDFIMKTDDISYVYYLSRSNKSCALVASPIDPGPLLREKLLFELETAIFVSATLAVHNGFKYFRESIGVNEAENWDLRTLQLESPFNYNKQVYFAVLKDLPEPEENSFAENMVNKLAPFLTLTKGRAFILFTSYKLMNQTVDIAKEKFPEFLYLVQGDKPRHHLLQDFRKSENTILFGTDSFWEGVDVPGEALSCVVITRLPFRVPTSPIVAARSEKMVHDGKNPFREYFLPQAIIKFKQGFGRLLRTKNDRGIILVCDQRIATKNYGQFFIKALPANCQVHQGSSERILSEVEKWFLP